MSNFIFALNATIPIFLVIVLGWVLKQIGMLDDHFTAILNRYVFLVALPLMLFKDIATTPIEEVYDPKFIGFCMIGTTLMFLGVWIFAEIFIKDKREVGAFAQAAARGSAAILGIAFVENIYGNTGMTPMMIMAAVPLYNIYSVIILSICRQRYPQNGPAAGLRASSDLQHRGAPAQQSAARSDRAGSESAAGPADGKDLQSQPSRQLLGGQKSGGRDLFINTVKGIITNPIILGILAGFPFSVLGITLPTILMKTISTVGSTASPMALLAVGASFEGPKAIKKIGPTAIATAIKLVIIPAIFFPFAIAMGFRESALVAILIMLGSPTTVSCYIMAKNMGNDDVLTSSIVVTATLFSAVTLTFWLYILRTMSLI